MKPPNVQSPFARVRHYPNTEGSNFYPLRGHYASIIARMDSFADPCGSSSFSLSLDHEVFAGCYQPLLPPGSSRRYPLRIFSQMLHPLPRLSLEVHLPVSSFESSAFPVLAMGRLPASFHVYDFTWCEISRLQIFLHVEASEFACLPGRSYRCILAGQPRLLRPGRTCFVTSACTGYANRPNQVIDGARTFTLLDSQPCRLLR